VVVLPLPKRFHPLADPQHRYARCTPPGDGGCDAVVACRVVPQVLEVLGMVACGAVAHTLLLMPAWKVWGWGEGTTMCVLTVMYHAASCDWCGVCGRHQSKVPPVGARASCAQHCGCHRGDMGATMWVR
jgi:hypothetical protein